MANIEETRDTKNTVAVGYECDVCGEKVYPEHIVCATLPDNWCEVDINFDGGYDNVDFDRYHVCSPECLIKLLDTQVYKDYLCKYQDVEIRASGDFMSYLITELETNR
jgi:hypothetical protein